MNENKIKHLEMLQGVITRMATNSFMIKGWALTLIAALLAFAPQDNVWVFVLMIVSPIFLFAFLDAYYLQLERKYRNKYDLVRAKDENQIDFDMKLGKECTSEKTAYCNCFFSRSIMLFYMPLIIISVGIILLLFVG